MQLSFSCISNLRFIPKSPKNPFFKVHLKLETWNLGVDCVFPWDKLMSDQDQRSLIYFHKNLRITLFICIFAAFCRIFKFIYPELA